MLVLILLCLTGTLYALNTKFHAENDARKFEAVALDSLDALTDRLQTYLLSIRGTAAFIAASDEVSHDDFKVYADSLELGSRATGITGIGLVVEVPDAEMAEFANAMRRTVGPEFKLRRISGKETHSIIKYMQPEEANAEAIGLDVTFATEVADAIELARATATTRLTPPIQLVQTNAPRVGAVLYHPIFAPTSHPTERGTFLGWVNGAFFMDDLFSSLTSAQDQNFTIWAYDGNSVETRTPLFDAERDFGQKPKFTASHQIEHFGRTWTIEFGSTPQFEAGLGTYQPFSIAVTGIALTALLFLILQNIRRRGEAIKEISDLKTRQIEARDQENRSIVENDITPVFLLDENDHVMFANQAAQRCFGLSEQEMRSKRLSSLAHKSQPTDGSFDAKGKTADGDDLELELHRNDWVNSWGERRSTVIMRDLTRQNTAQRELQQSKTLFDLALRGSEIGVFDIDLKTGKSEVSDTWCSIMGYPKDCKNTDTQASFLARVHPDDLPLLEEADADCIAGRTARSITEFRMKMPDGSWCWMRSDAAVSKRDEDGKAVRLIGTQTDITTEHHNRNALEASEKMLRQVLENAPIGTALMDDTGNFIDVNSAFSKLTGMSEAALTDGARISDFVPAGDRKPLYEAIATLMREDKGNVYSAEHCLNLPNGEERWGLLNVSWSLDKNTGRYLYIAQVVDVTDQKKVELMKDEFVSTVSHELRTPLTSIKGALGLLMVSPKTALTSSQERLIEIATSNANRLADIVNDILDLQKISSGSITFEAINLDLADVVKASAKEMSPFAVTQKSTIKVELPDTSLPVCVDEGRTMQLLANLISNACKYSDADSEVLVKAEQLNDLAIVYIQNRGPGVPEDFRSRIFEPFSQADSSDTRAVGGTGLGLNISRQIALRQGGKIGFESTPGGITVFWFTVPLSANVQPWDYQPPMQTFLNSSRKLRVLHVEDDHDFAEVLAGSLEEVAVVEQAHSLASAAKLIETSHFDVVVLDWSLPDGDASILIPSIKRLQPKAKIIGLSANNTRSDDPRLSANLTKSRAELSSILASISEYVKLAS